MRTMLYSNNASLESSGAIETFAKGNLTELFQMTGFEAISLTSGLTEFHEPSGLEIEMNCRRQQTKRKSSPCDTASEFEPACSKLKLEITGQAQARRTDSCTSILPRRKQPLALKLNVNATASSMLHTACKVFSKDFKVVQSALVLEPDSIRKRSKCVEAGESKVNKNSWTREHYSLPINIALRSQASMDVLKLLIDADRSVLCLQDGYSGCASLSIALKCMEQKSQNYCTVLDLILTASPGCITLKDRKLNFPLHVACTVGAPLDVIHFLYSNFPEALLKKNFYGETPLSIAERSMRCSEEVVNFLHSCSFVTYKTPFTARSA